MNRAQRTLVLVAALFAAPLIVSWVLYAIRDYWHPQPTAQHGELISPARPLPATTLLDAEGKRLVTPFPRGHWTLVHLIAGACTEDCVKVLQATRQVRLALGKDAGRVARLYVHTGSGPLLADAGMLEAQPDLLIARPAAVDRVRFTTPYGAAQDRYVYLVDPLGNLMMRYPLDTNPTGLLRDLQRLLRLSRIG